MSKLLISTIFLVAPLEAGYRERRLSARPVCDWFKSQRNPMGQFCCDKSDDHFFYGDYTSNPDDSIDLTERSLEACRSSFLSSFCKFMSLKTLISCKNIVGTDTALVARSEDELMVFPFITTQAADFPITSGDLLAMYEHAVKSFALNPQRMS